MEIQQALGWRYFMGFFILGSSGLFLGATALAGLSGDLYASNDSVTEIPSSFDYKSVDKEVSPAIKSMAKEDRSSASALVPAPKATPKLSPADLRYARTLMNSITYDPVPKEQVDSISDRLELTRKILLKTGRAYDYKTVTLRELQAISQALSVE